jgi:hypothetical protein
VDLQVRTRRVHGTEQELPTHVRVPDVDTAALLVGNGWPQRLTRGRARAPVLTGRYPHLSQPARTLAAVDALTDVDFALLCRAGDWFATHDATGLTPRQVPIEGLHAKWLNTRQHLVRELAGVDDLRLAPPHPPRRTSPTWTPITGPAAGAGTTRPPLGTRWRCRTGRRS